MSEGVKTFNKICGRMCVELTGHLASPLSVGSGEQEETDADVILDARGVPFIPGSAMAGVLRAYSRQLGLGEEADMLFGTPENGSPGAGNDRQSRIFCYDIFLENTRTAIRDRVKLGEQKTPVYGSKYEMQILERGADFRIRLEIIEREDCLAGKKDIQEVWKTEKLWIQSWVRGFVSGELRIGAKSSRGFGKLAIEKVMVKKFNMQVSDEYLQWLDWDWDTESAFEQAELIDIKNGADETGGRSVEHVLEVPLEIPYTLLVRTYSGVFRKSEGIPDYRQLSVNGEGNQALIPGSSFAGAFRSHIAKIVKKLAHLNSWEEAQKRLAPFFGTWVKGERQEENLLASKIIFEEVLVSGGHALPITRNAIDRFTGGTIEGGLFEGIPWAGGTAVLRIRWKKDRAEDNDNGESNSEVICGMLLWGIMDLMSGMLPVGGETAVGRGIFCPAGKTVSEISLDGDKLEDKEAQEYMQAAALWCKGGRK